MQSSDASSVNFWLGSGEHVWIEEDEWTDRAMRKLVTSTAQTVRILQTAADRGEVPLEQQFLI